jgi:dipeptidase E
MRLFLASHNFGKHADKLHEIIGDNKKMLAIFNARDYYDLQARNKLFIEKKQEYENTGFEVTELDLRDYFGKEAYLKKYIDNFNPGVIYAFGGNYFVLRRAFAQSGFDKILLNDLKNDKYVYAGGSAGAMITTPSLEYYGVEEKANIVPLLYDKDPIIKGLGLIDEYIIPHTNITKHAEKTKRYSENIKSASKECILLTDDDVLIVDGSKKEILK